MRKVQLEERSEDVGRSKYEADESPQGNLFRFVCFFFLLHVNGMSERAWLQIKMHTIELN